MRLREMVFEMDGTPEEVGSVLEYSRNADAVPEEERVQDEIYTLTTETQGSFHSVIGYHDPEYSEGYEFRHNFQSEYWISELQDQKLVIVRDLGGKHFHPENREVEEARKMSQELVDEMSYELDDRGFLEWVEKE